MAERWLVRFVSTLAAAIYGGGAVAAGEIRDLENQSNDDHPVLPLSPAEAAEGVVKSIDWGFDLSHEARLNGMDADRFDALVKLTGNPPGPDTLLAMWRRGIIADADVVRGLRQGYLKNEWVEQQKQLLYDTWSPTTAVMGVVQNHADVETAKRKWSEAGRPFDEFAVAVENAGRPLGPEQMLHLRNRGFMTDDDVRQGIRESDIKDKYVEVALHLGEYLPPPRTVTTLLSHGAISQATAQTLFQENGLSAELAAAYAASALHTKTASHKELSAATISSLYSDRILSRDQAAADLAKIGFVADDAQLVLDLADARAKQKLLNQGVNRVRTIFLARKIDAKQASQDLAVLNVPADSAAEMIAVWTIEQTTPSKTLSEAQLEKALKNGLITDGEFIIRTQALGYDAADAKILHDLIAPPPKPGG